MIASAVFTLVLANVFGVEPQYELRSLPFANSARVIVNSEGNACVRPNQTEGLLYIGGVIYPSLPFIQDINDRNVAVDTFIHTRKPPGGAFIDSRGIFYATVRSQHRVPISMINILTVHINNSDTVALNSTKNGVALGFRVLKGQLEQLAMPRTASASSVVDISEGNEILGYVTYGTFYPLNRHAPVVWADGNEIVYLEEPPGASAIAPTGLLSKDLAWGTCSRYGRRYPILWRKGSAEAIGSVLPDEVPFFVCRDDGTPIVKAKTGRGTYVKQLVNGTWIQLERLVRNLPKNTTFFAVKQRTADQSLLVTGRDVTGAKHFFLKALPQRR
jgi:hypothetical protein